MSDVLMTRRGGGMNLNFRVSRYAEGTDLSGVTGKTNEIAVLTDTPITEWSLNAEEPATARTGAVWIKLATSTKNTMEILKKNSLVLNLQGVNQYVSGAWEKCKAYLYQNGEWHDLDIFLFDNGDECTPETGGWIARRNSNGIAVIDGDHIRLSRGGSNNLGASMYSTDPVETRKYSKLCAVLTTASVHTLLFGLFTANTAAQLDQAQPYMFCGTTIEQAYSTKTKVEVDISSAQNTDIYYAGLSTTYNTDVYVYEVWFE